MPFYPQMSHRLKQMALLLGKKQEDFKMGPDSSLVLQDQFGRVKCVQICPLQGEPLQSLPFT